MKTRPQDTILPQNDSSMDCAIETEINSYTISMYIIQVECDLNVQHCQLVP